ncbi:MAG: aldo/keto reductase [Alphaproteobacteria bacterium]|nr:aldo/keto reductase [Alphaproteobacteria bacterium]MBU0793251.1 aldo/keto reductase [Alphaproteobacteria bacterium]MBU0875240.1 aldo/keto reductase [Alphaproteobacteria bacterium]MBU1771224.1 aldo/keto reductase [Alphaproteobacteria bacterium]
MRPSPFHASLSRRETMKLGAIAAVGMAFGASACASASDGANETAANQAAGAPASGLAPITKAIPSTGERIPVIGLGTNQYSVESEEELAQLQQVLEAMAQQGGKVIDTARGYGRAEEVIGTLLQRMSKRSDFFISTKTSIRGDFGDPDTEVQTALDRLKVDMIDLLLIHNLHGTDALMPALIRAKEAGKLRYIGMSTSTDAQYEEQMAGMRKYPLDFIQVDYSIANRSAADAIIPLAQERKMAVMVNMPFGGRRDAQTTTFGRVSGKPLPDWAKDIDATSWAQIFLKYVVSHPGVTVAIPGTTQVRHIIDNQGAGRGRLPDAAMRAEMERYWDSI